MPTETEKIKITVDGKPIEAPKGENLLKVLINNKVSIPYYCYHPGLSVAGACRMCFVEIEGQPRPSISCNMQVSEGMSVKTNTEKLREIQKWNLAFHLINHPIDCPICDQAGECGLQDYYMKYGKYDSDMNEQKVLKRKVVDIGEHIVLDTERCILCSRCVRFFDEVPKTGEMAIFNRGDKAEIGTYQDHPLKNNYTLNSVDICPVGALTSKDFRFKKRVWFLKDFNSICPGCSTGCNVTVSQDSQEKRNYRMRSRLNEDVNGYWMCDYGRMRYKHTNSEMRIQMNLVKKENELIPVEWNEAKEKFQDILKSNNPSELFVFVTPQYTTEELELIYDYFSKVVQTKNIYHCVDVQKTLNPQIVDEVFMRDDKNPNSNGLLHVSKKYNLDKKDFHAFQKNIRSSKVLFVFGPEDPEAYPEFLSWFEKHTGTKVLIGTKSAHATSFFDLIFPTLSFTEKNGTFMNFQGKEQKLTNGVRLVDEARPLAEILC